MITITDLFAGAGGSSTGAIQVPGVSVRIAANHWQLVTLRDGNVCVRCRRIGLAVSRDHRKNRSQGGLTVLSNLQLLCGDGTTGCHGWATEHPAEAIAEGWAVPGWPTADPAEWPARRWVRIGHGVVRLAWVLYDNEGGVLQVTEEEARERMTAMGWAA